MPRELYNLHLLQTKLRLQKVQYKGMEEISENWEANIASSSALNRELKNGTDHFSTETE